MQFSIIAVFAALLFLPQASCQLKINECSSWNDKKQICARATLYHDGTLAGEVTTESDNLFRGCRGGAVAVGSDRAGRAVWTAKLPGKTACGKLNVFCTSFRRNMVTDNVGADAAGQTAHIHLVVNANEKSFNERFRHLTSKIGNLIGDINALRGPQNGEL